MSNDESNSKISSASYLNETQLRRHEAAVKARALLGARSPVTVGQADADSITLLAEWILNEDNIMDAADVKSDGMPDELLLDDKPVGIVGPTIHIRMYRNGAKGTLCNSRAWGDDGDTCDAVQATCPACRQIVFPMERELALSAPDAMQDDHANMNCAWADYRKDYGVATSTSNLTAARSAFKAGWEAHRDGDQSSPLR